MDSNLVPVLSVNARILPPRSCGATLGSNGDHEVDVAGKRSFMAALPPR